LVRASCFGNPELYSRDRALMRNAGVEKSEKGPVIHAIAQFMTPSITEKATGKVAF